MNSQRIGALVKKDLKKLVRAPEMLFMILGFPVLLTVAFGTGFGAGGGGQTTYQIGLVNMDKGAYAKWSSYFVGNLTGVQILKMSSYDTKEQAQADLAQGKVQAVLIVPSNFGESCNSFWSTPREPGHWINATISLYLDSGSIFATQVIPPIIEQIVATAVYGQGPASIPRPIQIGTPSLVETEKFSTFDYMAPGLFTFAAIFLVMTVAQSFTVDRENGLLRRINVTPTTPAEFMTSQVIFNMIAALAQVAMVFTAAYLLGFRPNAGLPSYALAFGIVLVFCLCNVGFGLITATIAKSPDGATGISFVFIIPQMFLGTFVGLALSSTAQAAGMLLPSYYVTDALTSLFLRGAPISSPKVLLDLAVVSFTSIVVLLVGVEMFRKYGKR